MGTNGANSDQTQFGRKVSNAVTRASLRGFMRSKAMRLGAVFAASISLASSTPDQEVPEKEGAPYEQALYSDVGSDRVRAEQRAMEEAYQDLVLVPVEYAAFTFVEGAEHNLDPARPSAEDLESGEAEIADTTTYYSFNRTQMYEYFLEQFNRAGSFNQNARQNAPSHVYFEGEIPRTARERNEAMAQLHADQTIATMTTGNLGQATPMRFSRDFKNELGQMEIVNRRVCRVILMPTHYTPAIYASRYTGIDDLQLAQNIDMADLQQTVANHEYTHCLYAGSREQTWYNESLADLYAIARHIQLNGDDEYIYQRRALRNLNVLHKGGFHHDTIPLLDRAIPGLLEAYADKRLDNLNPRQLMDVTMNIALGEPENGARPGFAALEEEVDTRERLMTDYEHLITYDTRQMASIDREKLAESKLHDNPEDLAMLERILESHNNSVEYLFSPNEQERRQPLGRPDTQNAPQSNYITEAYRRMDLALAYRRGLDELVETLPTDHDRYDAVGYVLYRLDKIEENWRNDEDISDKEFIERVNTPDFTGLTHAEQRPLLEIYHREYAQRLGLAHEFQECVRRPEEEHEHDRVS